MIKRTAAERTAEVVRKEEEEEAQQRMFVCVCVWFACAVCHGDGTKSTLNIQRTSAKNAVATCTRHAQKRCQTHFEGRRTNEK